MCRVVGIQLTVIVLALLGGQGRVRAESEDKLLAFTMAAHRSAQERIHSLSCSVRLESRASSKKLVVTEGRYWRSFDRARIQQETSTGSVDYYFIDRASEVRGVTRNRAGTGQPRWWADRQWIADFPHPLDVWRRMLLEFESYMSMAKPAPRVSRETFKGRSCVRVELTLLNPGRSDTHVTFWLDIGRNFLVFMREMTTGVDRDVSEVSEFANPADGVYFPIKIEGRSFHGDEQRADASAVLSELRINEAISKDVLELPRVPSGTMLSDFIKRQTYPIDASWEQLAGSNARPLERHALPVPVGAAVAAESQSRDERKSWTWLIAPMSLVVLSIAGAVWLYSRRRRNALEDD